MQIVFMYVYIYICDKIHYSLEKPLVLGGNMPKQQSRAGFAAKKSEDTGEGRGGWVPGFINRGFGV